MRFLQSLTASNHHLQRRCCSYPNGLWTVLAAQFLLALAWAMTALSAMGCELVTISANFELILKDANDDWDNGNITISVNETRRGVGLWKWQGVEGQCVSAWNYPNASESGEDEAENLFETFRSVTGFDWDVARWLSVAAVVLIVPLGAWLATLTCFVHTNIWRNLLGVVLLLVVTSVQSKIWIVESSEFCKLYQCEMGSTSAWLTAAVVATGLSGILVIISRRKSDNVNKQQHHLDATSSNDLSTVMEEERRRDGLNNAQEVPVENELIDVSLVSDPRATAVAHGVQEP